MTALPAFAQRITDNTAIPVEHHMVSELLITLGQVTSKRVGDLTITTVTLHDGTSGANGAAARALFALVDMADVFSGTPGVLFVDGVLPVGWCVWLG